MRKTIITILVQIFLLAVVTSVVHAGVLPDERLDALYHSYDGGGVQVTGPSVLVRKGIGTSFSTFYNYYTDYITSASIDVITAGSEYEEERTEQTLGLDYLHGKTTMTFSLTNSSENDYEANTISFGISQDFFGDLTTLTMGYSQGADDVSRRGSSTVLSSIDRRSYRVGLSQIMTKNSTLAFNWETITDEADENNTGVTLNNPYRSYHFGDATSGRQLRPEIYPRTRTSNAFALRGNYYLPWKSALHAEYRYFQDSWGIRGDTLGMGYVHPKGDWIFDFRYRLYSQNRADFYSDLFASEDQFTYMARDKELSTFSSTSFGMSASYEFAKNGWGWIDKGSLNLSYDHIVFDYDDFRDNLSSEPAGTEPFYEFEADVIQAFISIWY